MVDGLCAAERFRQPHILRHHPTLPLIVRAHNKEAIDDLYTLGAKVVVAEDMRLAETLMTGLDHLG
ncbi:MAG: hypothetical protein ACKO57_01060 [Alphaproteobacteria bacterium]